MSKRKRYDSADYYGRKKYREADRLMIGWDGPYKSSSSRSKSGRGKRSSSSATAKKVYAKYKPKRYAYQRSTVLAPALGALGGLAGTYFGGPALAGTGRAIGEMLGHGFKTITGYGDYTVRENSLAPGAPPSVANGALPGGAVIISFKEFMGDIISSSSANTFKLQSFPLNPGLSDTFPWLSQIAGNFQQYKFMGMAFEYRTMSADALNSTNTALGSLIMATNYDALSPVYNSKAEMENCAYAQSVKPSSSCLHLIECDSSTLPLSELYLRTGDVPNGADKRMYDIGNFQIATTGFQGTSVNCGELWVTYQVMLMKPKLWDALGNDVDYFLFYNDTGISNAVPLGTVSAIEYAPFTVAGGAGNNMDVTISSAGVVTIPGEANSKSYEVTIVWIGDRTASLVYPGVSYTNCTLGDNHYLESAGSFVQLRQIPDSNAASLSTRLTVQFVVVTNGNNVDATFSLTGAGTLPANPTAMSCTIQEIPYQSVDTGY